jgi:hypothetical protein
VITVELARRLRDAGMPWTPASGDRFVVARPGMEADVFVLADLLAEVHDFVDGAVIGFNGTVEWALDSVALADVVWLPREEQLRAALGDRFVRLEAVPGGYVVVTRPPDDGGRAAAASAGGRHTDLDAERAYARALLAALGG